MPHLSQYPYLYAPFHIFIKGVQHLKNEEILEQLGVIVSNIKVSSFEYQKIISKEEEEGFIYMYRDTSWVHIVDDCFYSLWFWKAFMGNIQKMGRLYEIFHCSVGDADHSFDFFYYKDGELIRAYVVEDPSYQQGIIIKNIGKPLDEEQSALQKEDAQEKVLSLATSLAIDLNYQEEKVMFYKVENLPPDNFVFNEDEY